MTFFARTFVGASEVQRSVLDVGSYNVNGSYKRIFPEPNFLYQGLDMEPGPNVDIVEPFPYRFSQVETDSYDIVISGQAFEHIEFFWLTMGEIVRAAKRGGLICIIAPNGFREHRYPVDCYRFYTDGMVALARYYQLEILHASTDKAPEGEKYWSVKGSEDSILVARKPYSGPGRPIDPGSYVCIPINHKEINKPLV